MTSDLETAAKANDVASNSSLAPAERVIQLRQMAEGVKNVELLGQIEGYIGSLELQREAQAMEQGLNRVALRENANIRDYLIETGRVTADDLDKAGYLSHAELDAREADGTLSEAIDLTLREGMARKALRWEKGFEKGGEFRPTRGGDAGRRVTKALPTGREDASRKAEKPPAKGKAPQAGKALPDPPESPGIDSIQSQLAEVRKFGLNDWPEIGERGRE